MPPKATSTKIFVYGVEVQHIDSVPRVGVEKNIGEYRTWRNWKLKRELEQRGLPIPDLPNKGDMAKALRRNDEDDEELGSGPYSAFTTPANSPSSTVPKKSPILTSRPRSPRGPRGPETPRTPKDQPPATPFRKKQFKGLLEQYLRTAPIGETERGHLGGIIDRMGEAGIDEASSEDDVDEEGGLIIPVFSEDEFELA